MMPLRLIFGETTRACNLECPHCRASAIKTRLPEELTTQEAKSFIDSAALFLSQRAMVRPPIAAAISPY